MPTALVNHVIICLGSNMDPSVHVQMAKFVLKQNFENICFTSDLWNKAVGIDSYLFLNVMAYFTTSFTRDQLKIKLKEIEQFCGNDVKNRQNRQNGQVKIDIDLLSFNNQRLKKEDWNREYVQTLYAEIKSLCKVKIPRME